MSCSDETVIKNGFLKAACVFALSLPMQAGAQQKHSHALPARAGGASCPRLFVSPAPGNRKGGVRGTVQLMFRVILMFRVVHALVKQT